MRDVLREVWRGLAAKREKRPWFSLVTTLLFCAAIAYVHHRHEFWRDEMHCWSLARNSTGLWDLLTGVRRYDGHPFLWYYLLYLVSRWSRSEVGLHVLTIAIATGSTYLWLRHANLPRVLRVMLLPTYLYFFEYNVMSRSYVLGVFLVFLFCRLYERHRLRVFWLVLVLVFLSFTSAYGALLAVALGAFLLWQNVVGLLPGRLAGWRKPTIYWEWLLGSLALVLAWVVHLKTSLPPKDVFYRPIGLDAPNLLSANQLPVRIMSGLFPWHWGDTGDWVVAGHVGQHSFLVMHHVLALTAVIVLLWLAAVRRAPSIVVSMALGLFLMFAFQRHQYVGYLRHWGHIWILFLACAWLYAKQVKSRRPPKLLYGLAGVTMAIQIVTGISAVRAEIAMPFSGAKEAAGYLRGSGLDKGVLAGALDYPTSAVAGYLDRGIRYALTDRESPTALFSNQRIEYPKTHDILIWTRQVAEKTGSPIILILTFDLGRRAVRGLTTQQLYVTQKPLRADERFWIYRCTVQDPSP